MKLRNCMTGLILLLTAVLFAQDGWILDKAHSSVSFEAEHIVVLDNDLDSDNGYPTVGVTDGIFQEFEVKFVPGKNNFEDSKFVAQISANSIDTDNIIRDMDLKSENFFAVEKFPTITFQSTAFEYVSPGKYRMTGELTIRGVTKTIELDAMLTQVSNDLSDYLSFTATGLVDRFDYGMRWSDIFENGRFRISQYIKLRIQTNFVNFTKS